MENLNSNLISQIFQQFIEGGGEPKVTAFKKYLDRQINDEIKPLCGRSGKAGLVDDWRSEVKLKFSGRGAKWVMVSLAEIAPTLETYGYDVVEYRNWIDKAGYAWIRYTGPRVVNGVKSAAFEVRTGGSTIDHPKQLHYIAIHELDDKVTPLAATPHAMRLEERATSPVVEDDVEAVVEAVLDMQDPMTNGFDVEDEDVMGDIEALMAMEDEEL
jgi:hypothetical protein